MNRIQKRVTRVTGLISIIGVLTLGAAPAMAASPITYYQGTANAQALYLNVAPSAILNADLSFLANQLTSLPAPLGALVCNGNGVNVCEALTNVTAPINVTADTAHADGISNDGTNLATGAASTTPVSVDAAALNSELNLLKAAITNIPAATTTALLNALAPLTGSSQLSGVPTASLLAAIQALSNALSDTLGNPAVNVFDKLDASLPGTFGPAPGETKNNGNVVVQGGGVLTPQYPFILGPFEANAQPSDATANNNLTHLSLIPTGNVGLQNIPTDLATILTDLGTFITNAGDALCALASLPAGCPLATVASTLNLQVITNLVNGLNGLNAQFNSIIAQLNSALGIGLGGLQLNDIAGTDPNTPSTALSTLSRQGDKVQADSIGNLASVNVLTLTNPNLIKILNQIASGAGIGDVTGKNLLTVDGVKGTADVALDGVNAPPSGGGMTNGIGQLANGSLLDVQILGKSLSALSNGQLSLDAILPQGTSCVIQIPGAVTCHGLQGLGTIIPGGTPLDGLLTVTLTRGAPVYDPNASVTEGSASIVTLEVTVNLDCTKIAQVVTALNGVLGQLPVKLTLCGSNGAGGQLVDLRLGVANAAVSLTASSQTGTQPAGASQPAQNVPNTGNSAWILGMLAAMLVMAGAGIGVFRARSSIQD